MMTKNDTFILIWKPFKESVFLGWINQEFDSLEELEIWKFKIMTRYPKAVFVESMPIEYVG